MAVHLVLVWVLHYILVLLLAHYKVSGISIIWGMTACLHYDITGFPSQLDFILIFITITNSQTW